ncbi:MAG: hypothetical protein KF878_23405 [Planctomycetes bacterium]|nr:hypothetical protein [Planctomycetota bacterium]
MGLLERWLKRDDGSGPVAPPPRPATPPLPEERDTTRKVRKSLDARAQELDLDKLEAQGHKRVRVVDAATIEAIVADLVDQAVRRRDLSLTAEERAQVQDAFRLRQRLEQLEDDNGWLERQRKDLERRVDELERDKLELGRQCEDLTTEVWTLRRALEEREATPAPPLSGAHRRPGTTQQVVRPRPEDLPPPLPDFGSDTRRLEDLERRLDELKRTRARSDGA